MDLEACYRFINSRSIKYCRNTAVILLEYVHKDLLNYPCRYMNKRYYTLLYVKVTMQAALRVKAVLHDII